MSLLTLRRSLGMLFSLIIVLSLGILNSYGQGKNFSVSRTEPSWILKIAQVNAKPSLKDVSDGYYLSLYENQNHAERNEEFVHMIREIVSDAGVQNGSQISVGYAPDYQKLIFHKVILWRNNIPHDQLSAKKFKILQTEKELSRFIYNGTYDAFLLLEDVRKGDRIEFSYSLQGENPIFGKKFSSTFYLQGQQSIGHVYTNVIVDKQRTLNVKNFNGANPPKLTQKDNLKYYEWETTLPRIYRPVDYQPSWYNPLKRVQLSEYKSWNQVVEWGLAIVNNYKNLNTPLLNKKVAELKSISGSNKNTYIELATRFVQDQIRYMGIEIGAYSHRPNTPEKVLTQRYGDCKDKSLLLVYLLKAMNVNAWTAYTNGETNIKTSEYLPSPFVFNHVIVVVENEKHKTWIDPTISYQRGKFDDFYAPDYGYALIIKPGVNALDKIISTPKGKLTSKATFNIADTLSDEKSSLIIRSTYTSNYADNIRNYIAESGHSELEKEYLEYYRKFYTDITSAATMKISDDQNNNSVEITENYQIDNIWTQDEDSQVQFVSVYADLISGELRKVTAKNRPEPFSLKKHVNLQQEIVVNMPYVADYQAPDVKVNNDYYSFELKNSQKDKTAIFNYSFKSLKGYIDGAELKNYAKDYQKVNSELNYTISAGGIDVSSSQSTNFAILAIISTLIATSFYLIKLYRKRTDFDVAEIVNAKPISGWLMLLAIRVFLGPVVLFTKLIVIGFFDNSFWDNLEKTGKGNLFKVAYAIDLIGYSILISFSILTILLFIGRRQSFPRLYIMVTKWMIVATSFSALLSVLRDHSQLSFIPGYQIAPTIVSIVISLLVIWYLKKSEKVKQTFVFSYPKADWTIALVKHYNKILTQQEK